MPIGRCCRILALFGRGFRLIRSTMWTPARRRSTSTRQIGSTACFSGCWLLGWKSKIGTTKPEEISWKPSWDVIMYFNRTTLVLWMNTPSTVRSSWRVSSTLSHGWGTVCTSNKAVTFRNTWLGSEPWPIGAKVRRASASRSKILRRRSPPVRATKAVAPSVHFKSVEYHVQ